MKDERTTQTKRFIFAKKAMVLMATKQFFCVVEQAPMTTISKQDIQEEHSEERPYE